jgi:hypothetical protein
MASFPQASPPTPCAHLYPPPYAPHALPISFVLILPPRTILGKEYRSFSSSLCSFLHSPVTSSLVRLTYLPQCFDYSDLHQFYLALLGRISRKVLMFVDRCIIVQFILKNPTRCNNVSKFIILHLYEAQHVSGNTPPIIRSLQLHWQVPVHL